MEKKYEMLMDEANTLVLEDGQRLHRIKALRDFGNVKAGEIGGYIEKEENLSHDGTCWVADYAQASGNAEICGDILLCGHTIYCV